MFQVIIPVAGKGSLLGPAVNSALSPLVDRIWVVADEPQSLPAVQQAVALDPRVSTLSTPGDKPAGPGAARNLALDAATSFFEEENRGEFLAFLDADDEYAPGYFEVLADFLTSNSRGELPLVHTRLIHVDDPTGKADEWHPLRFRFAGGSRRVSLALEPHTVGTSVAAAIFRTARVQELGLRFAEGINWSEDSDFIVRFLLGTGAQEVGVCAEARYLYRVNQGGSTTQTAWHQPLKYTLPFERFYLPWTALAGGQLPVWLQNHLLYELSMYLQVDREVFSPAFAVDAEVLARCAGYIRQVLGALDEEVIRDFALVPLGLDRRQIFLAHTRQGALRRPYLSGQVYAYAQKPWQKDRKYTYFYLPAQGAGDLLAEDISLDGKSAQPGASKWVSHTLFGVEMVRERILWFPDQPTFTVAGQPLVSAPYAGAPQLPSPTGTQTGREQSAAARSQPAKPPRTLRQRIWHLRQRLAGKASPASAPAAVQANEPVWFYADRAHRAGDNAEALYRYASVEVPGVRHIFALSAASPDWDRLKADGFSLVNTDDSHALGKAVAEANELLLSDISDVAVGPLLSSLRPNQRLVFLQHGILRHEHWRWLNPRRVDLMFTTADDETDFITRDGSSYTFTVVEVAQTGLPRHDRLLELAQAENRQDRVLIAPTWDRSLLKAGAEELQAWVDRWVSPFTEETFGLLLPAVEPVLFIHPNLEQALVTAGVQMPVTRVFGSEVQKVLVRSVAVVTDRSSLVDEAVELGVPGVLVGSTGVVSAPRVYSPAIDERTMRIPGGNATQLQQAVATAALGGRFGCRLKPGASKRVVEQIRSTR